MTDPQRTASPQLNAAACSIHRYTAEYRVLVNDSERC